MAKKGVYNHKEQVVNMLERLIMMIDHNEISIVSTQSTLSMEYMSHATEELELTIIHNTGKFRGGLAGAIHNHIG